MTNGKLKPIEIFRVGTHTPMQGAPITFSESDVESIADDYDPERSEAPIVVGHPQTDAPAYGWIKGLIAIGGVLVATPKQVEPAFAEAVNEGRFKKVSASFYAPTSPGNPTPGRWYLKHVGFLGAAAPAVRGLKNASFAQSAGVLTFAETDFSAYAGGSHAQREAALRLRENEVFLEDLIRDGRFLPAHRSGALAFMESLEGAGTVSFAEGGEQVTSGAKQWFRSFLRATPKLVHYGRHPIPPMDFDAAPAFAAPRGRTVDTSSMSTHQEIVALSQSRNISYEEALKIVAQRKD